MRDKTQKGLIMPNIEIKVQKIKAASTGGNYVGRRGIDMSDIQRMQKKAVDSGKSLAEVYRDERKLKDRGQVKTIQEVQAEIAARKAAKEAAEETVETAEVTEETETEPVETTGTASEVKAAVEPVEDSKEPSPETEDGDTGETKSEEKTAEVAPEPTVDPKEAELAEFKENASKLTVKELREFAKSMSVSLSATTKDAIIDELANELEDLGVLFEYIESQKNEEQ